MGRYRSLQSIMLAEALKGIGDGGGHSFMAGGVIYSDIDEYMKDNIEAEVQKRFLNAVNKGCENVR